MFVYYMVGAFATLSALIAQQVRHAFETMASLAPIKRHQLWTPFDFMSVAVLSAFAGARYFVGTDYWLYDGLSANMKGLPLGEVLSDSPQEWGFTTFAYLVGRVFPIAGALFLVSSIVTVCLVYQTFRRESDNVAASVALYVLFAFYVTPFNTTRQGLAVALVFYGRSKWRDSRVIAGIILGIAISMHASAALAVLILLLVRYLGALRFFTLGAVVLSVVGAAATLASPQVRTLVGYLNPRYSDYLGESGAGLGTIGVAAVFLLLALMGAWLRNPFESLDERLWRNYVVVGVAFLIAGVAAAPVSRMSQYFSIYLVLLAPRLLGQQRSRRWLYIPLFAMGALFFAFWLENYDGLLPYRWIGQ